MYSWEQFFIILLCLGATPVVGNTQGLFLASYSGILPGQHWRPSGSKASRLSQICAKYALTLFLFLIPHENNMRFTFDNNYKYWSSVLHFCYVYFMASLSFMSQASHKIKLTLVIKFHSNLPLNVLNQYKEPGDRIHILFAETSDTVP